MSYSYVVELIDKQVREERESGEQSKSFRIVQVRNAECPNQDSDAKNKK